MTAPAIKMDPGIGMTGDAEIVFGRCYATRLGAGMTLDAPFEAVLGGAYTLAQCLDTVMLEQVGVVAANDIHILHALITLAVLQSR
ncbi:MAG: hypothetical protein COS39_10585 [Hydrogenophilales bacterium CG03_land_8_20_14_0_80_62_28]|nr:MAG: hypothetical protein AUJ86_10725 [Hydrogenophilaceae bacterium CG1_02_62_390]PIV21579.1 MAG: hypothetical protein COS39_10585 [Hydrogenophilales bacterium CG03_land_8_20_14_0_80_62_28]PIW39680.1 MAG: hypothetical protein COW23_00185 [Hydrogenophilales bacterium CG15_BIG_FIL_POST_REV_8_21_14_020_62_31]PIW72011.1 MAG: hypothetical protein COW07_04815 [Hydrogenophilales bacterium CG12_big_fil_rev_8_21_14_0_65_61_21]PIY97851.1 MAG: hypothetical protein COY64_09030 [Hydrogenophilales bacteri